MKVCKGSQIAEAHFAEKRKLEMANTAIEIQLLELRVKAQEIQVEVARASLEQMKVACAFARLSSRQ